MIVAQKLSFVKKNLKVIPHIKTLVSGNRVAWEMKHKKFSPCFSRVSELLYPIHV